MRRELKHQFCGHVATHQPHPWRPVWRRWTISTVLIEVGGRGRWCEGGTISRCGRDITHPVHWHGELRDELCPGGGLAGVCKHGVQMLNDCPRCTASNTK